MIAPAAKREAVAHLQATLGMSERRACMVVGADRKSMRYRSCRADNGDAAEQAAAIALLNDSVFGFMGIASRFIVENGLVSRTALADALEHRAGFPDAVDHNPLLLTFARAVRMNLPGGRFDIIDGGRSELDPNPA